MLAVLDIETDPFDGGRPVAPFCAEILVEDGTKKVWWGDDCMAECAAWIATQKLTIYAHNGGRFDFHFLLDYCQPQKIFVLDGRVAKVKLGGSVLIDSWPFVPIPLRAYRKDDIDYHKLEAWCRDDHRDEILAYLHADCVYLLELLQGLFDLAGGRYLTIGSAAFAQLEEMGITIPQATPRFDQDFRPYYFGGRCQAFQTGYFPGPLKYVDINSAYPRAMIDDHPWGFEYVSHSGEPDHGSDFVHFTAASLGAFPIRDETGKVHFPDDGRIREFRCTGWEYLAAKDTGALDKARIIETRSFMELIDFGKFIRKFYRMKREAKESGDKVGELFAKLMLNSAYGKFAVDPTKFKEYQLLAVGDRPDGEWDYVGAVTDNRDVWRRPAHEKAQEKFVNVTVAASITGWVRAYLWRSICQADGVLYCDTDSMICKEFHGRLSPELGDWKLEHEVERAVIAGRKLYTIQAGGKWHTRSKGVKLDEVNLFQILSGDTVEYTADAPAYTLRGVQQVTRRIKKLS